MNYELEICGLTRELELFPVSDDTAIAAFILFSDVEITKASAAALLERAPEFDVIITAESKGIPLAYEMARQAGTDDYVVARKKTKLYGRCCKDRSKVNNLRLYSNLVSWT